MENQVEMEEKTRLINQVLELQHTLEGNTDTHTHHFIFMSWEITPMVQVCMFSNRIYHYT